MEFNLSEFKEKHKTIKGQAMVEAIVAITIAVVGLLGVFSLLSKALGLNQVVTSKYIAASLAAEGIEVVNNLINSNVLNSKPFNDGSCLAEGQHNVDYTSDFTSSCSYSDDYLKFDSTTGLYAYGKGDKTTLFKRAVTISWPSADQIKVKSKVSWVTRGGAEFDLELEDSFFNWR